MRICFIIGTLTFSGAEKVLTALASHFADLGHDVHVVLTLPGEGDVSSPNRPFHTHRLVADGVRPVRILKRLTRIRGIVATVAPDVSISFGYSNNINTIPALVGNGVPHIVCERNNPLYDPPGLVPIWMRRILYPFAAAFVFQTEVIRDLFPGGIRRRSVVIANPVIDTFSDHHSEGAGDSECRIVTVGRLSDRDKNQSLLIRAFARLSDEFPDWILELYGDGPDRQLFEQMVAAAGIVHRVRFRGQVENPGAALENADLFVLPSRTEGMPNALIEAMSAGVACVATDCSGGGAAALINDGVNGLICPNEDEDALVATLRRAMRDPEFRLDLGRSARRIRETHSLERIGREWLEAIHAQLR